MWSLFKILIGLGFIADGLYVFILGGIMGRTVETEPMFAMFGISDVSGWIALLAGTMDTVFGILMIVRRKHFL